MIDGEVISDLKRFPYFSRFCRLFGASLVRRDKKHAKTNIIRMNDKIVQHNVDDFDTTIVT